MFLSVSLLCLFFLYLSGICPTQVRNNSRSFNFNRGSDLVAGGRPRQLMFCVTKLLSTSVLSREFASSLPRAARVRPRIGVRNSWSRSRTGLLLEWIKCNPAKANVSTRLRRKAAPKINKFTVVFRSRTHE